MSWNAPGLRASASLASVTYSINVTVVVTLNLVDFLGDAGTLYTSLTTTLQTAVGDGTFTSYVQQAAVVFGSSAMTTVSAAVVSVSAAVVVNPPSFSPTVAPSKAGKEGSTGLSVGAIVGIVLGVVALLMVLGIAVLWAYRRIRPPQQRGLDDVKVSPFPVLIDIYYDRAVHDESVDDDDRSNMRQYLQICRNGDVVPIATI
jgi:hypothetical protein